ncbi:hypothetical protein LUZ61_020669 [Rhynchospora tenuis]|uniref:Phosphate transporter PHO1 n=1 Tax=Rhynchospora tenuis TaxID=198213 RepID=A0AAD5ZDU9_9POAL|nr:hypothetical protein LUZ61_020669 [Rhynchospora tenuis]
MKFSRELEAQLVHEWRDGYVDYKRLKKIIKNIKVSLNSSPKNSSESQSLLYGFSIADPIRSLVTRFSSESNSQNRLQGDEENGYELDLVQSGDEEVKSFVERAEKELEKVNDFYTRMEEGFCQRGEEVLKQLQILLEVKQVLKESRHRRPRRRAPSLGAASPGSTGALLSGINSPSPVPVGTPTRTEEAQQEQIAVVEEVIAALERNGVTFIGSARGKVKKEAKPRADVIRIDIPGTTPTLSFMNFWESLVNGLQKEGEGGNGYHLNRMKIQKAEKMIREALVELYKGLERMKKYSSLNLLAFTKIIKKFTKVTNEEDTSVCFMKKVKGSQFIVSDKVLRLQDEVESLFTMHFASNDRKIARISLKPQQNKDSHAITFFAGLFTGTFVTLFSVYAILAHFCGIFTSTSTSGYVETVYPVFSMFALISLHIFLYGCNLFMWKSTRINNNFIFDFKPNTALKHRDAFLISSAFMTAVVGAMVAHLFLKYNHVSSHHLDAIPGILLLICLGLLVCPFNILYRETRFCFLRVIRNIVFSPLYKVLMADFFMADQLTSQIPLFRYMEFTACYFIAGGLKAGSYETCNSSHQYKLLAYVISFLPYYWRAMQCIRRYMEEGYDINHMANCGKYISAMVAAAARMLYAMDPTPVRLALAIIACSGATLYQLYWDFVKDWGLMNPKSKNFFLRDQLILKKKSIYYFSMGLNVVLRLAWIESVMKINLGPVEHRLVDFTLASLEIIRRGHWNYYRLENEHLNNVGKFRTMKNIPLPFREMDSD